jgi:hypothetical protein
MVPSNPTRPIGPPAITLNDAKTRRVEVRRFGREQHPVLVVDDALADADAIRAYALGTQFRPEFSMDAAYQSHCMLRGVSALGEWVARTMCTDGFGIDPEPHVNGAECEATFTIFAPVKDFPYGTVHVVSHSWLTMLVCLTPGEEDSSGTAFWRHAPTGLESSCSGDEAPSLMGRIDELFGTQLLAGSKIVQAHAPKSSYLDWARSLFLAAPCKPPFPSTDHGPWELLGSVSARYNRLIAFPIWVFQSVLMKRDAATTLETARLTLSAFIRHQGLEPRERLPVEPVPGLDA